VKRLSGKAELKLGGEIENYRSNLVLYSNFLLNAMPEASEDYNESTIQGVNIPPVSMLYFPDLMEILQVYFVDNMFLFENHLEKSLKPSRITAFILQEYLLSYDSCKMLSSYMMGFFRFLKQEMAQFKLDELCFWPLWQNPYSRNEFFKNCGVLAKEIIIKGEMLSKFAEYKKEINGRIYGMRDLYFQSINEWIDILEFPYLGERCKIVLIEVNSLMINLTIYQYHSLPEKEAKNFISKELQSALPIAELPLPMTSKKGKFAINSFASSDN